MHEYSWDVELFRFQEKQVSGNYAYILDAGAGETETLTAMYHACISFLQNCQMPWYVQGRTLLNVQTFGVEGFTAETLIKLKNWASAILDLNQKINLNGRVPRGSFDDSELFH